MTVNQPPVWLQTKAHDAEDVRRWMAAVMFGTTGVFGETEMAVTVSAGLTVSISDGRCAIAGNENTYQGTYFGENRGATTVTLTGANATNPRIDLIVARMRDSVYSGLAANDGFTIEKVDGTAAATPAAPATPVNSLVLAQVTVPAGATTLVAGNISDKRTMVKRPGVQVFASAASRTLLMPAPTNGDISVLLDSTPYRLEFWTGSAWSKLVPTITVSTGTASGGVDGDLFIKVV